MHASDFRKIDLVCAQEEERSQLQCVYLHQEHLYAADGYIGARLPAHPTDQDTDGAIPMQAVAIARGANSTITANETVRVSARKCTFDRPKQGWLDCFEDFRKNVLVRPGPQPKTHNPIITLDIQRLWNLAQAICPEQPWLEIYLGQSSHDAILVKPLDCHGDTLGAIMPMCPPTDGKKADLWHALGRLREHIDNEAEKVCLADDLLTELRKVLCIEQK